MTGKPGRYLTPVQTLRLAIIHNASRDRVIEMIVKGMRKHARLCRDGGATPHSFYSQPFPPVE